jgi:DNA modification methylase
LDCFAGSGTTADAAHDLGRNSINIEADKNYFVLMKKRLEHILNIKVVKINDIKKIAIKTPAR